MQTEPTTENFRHFWAQIEEATRRLLNVDTERQFDQASHRCASPDCTSELWNVQCVSVSDQLWRVSNETDGSYLIAGVMPACPLCGATLFVDAELCEPQSTNKPLATEQGESILNWN